MQTNTQSISKKTALKKTQKLNVHQHVRELLRCLDDAQL